MVVVYVLAGVVFLAGMLQVIGRVSRSRDQDRVSNRWLDEHVGRSGKQ